MLPLVDMSLGQLLQALAALAIACTVIPLLLPQRALPMPPATAGRRPPVDLPAPPPLEPIRVQQAAFARVANYIEATGDRVQRLQGATSAASRHIDVAEIALLRLAREIAPLMHDPIVAAVAARRTAT
jgi:hypothetical protein